MDDWLKINRNQCWSEFEYEWKLTAFHTKVVIFLTYSYFQYSKATSLYTIYNNSPAYYYKAYLL